MKKTNQILAALVALGLFSFSCAATCFGADQGDKPNSDGSSVKGDADRGIPAAGSAPAAASTQAPVKPWALYNRYCAMCHGSSKQGIPASTIQNVINANIGGMGMYTTLSYGTLSALAAGQ